MTNSAAEGSDTQVSVPVCTAVAVSGFTMMTFTAAVKALPTLVESRNSAVEISVALETRTMNQKASRSWRNRAAIPRICNPHQTPAGVTVPEESGFQVLSGRPGYINFLDALGAWQLVRELRAANERLRQSVDKTRQELEALATEYVIPWLRERSGLRRYLSMKVR